MHEPVLLDETLEYLAVRPEGIYVDATCGLGGHTGAIARRGASVIAADRDAESIEKARANTADVAERIRFVHTPFAGLRDALAQIDIGKATGLLADLGVSRYQLTEPERGFTFQAAGPVDMRMDRSQAGSAHEIVNYWAEKALADLIFQLGEERRARHVSRAIVRARPIRDTAHLAHVVESAVPRTGRLHPATKTFMALRLAVNDELGQLDALLSSLTDLVGPGGRVVILTFMSLEDRKVKRVFQGLAREGKAVVLTKHVVRPREDEVRRNAASRSAMLRALELT